MTCPVCGAASGGRSCSECGASLTETRCAHCEASVAPGSRYCPLCGRPLDQKKGRNRAVAWVVAGASIAALSAALLVRMTSVEPRRSAGEAPAAPDISSLTPRERADRLFARVMQAVEIRDTAQVNFFVPMALQSYNALRPLDADTRYHVGLLQFVNRDFRAALAQADSIASTAQRHLLASLLRSQVRAVQGDTASRNRAYRDFLAAYDAEMATDRPEYSEHRSLLAQVREQARQAVGKT